MNKKKEYFWTLQNSLESWVKFRILSELHKSFILLREKHFPKPKSKHLVWFDG